LKYLFAKHFEIGARFSKHLKGPRVLNGIETFSKFYFAKL
jgi:hypothetical protein